MSTDRGDLEEAIGEHSVDWHPEVQRLVLSEVKRLRAQVGRDQAALREIEAILDRPSNYNDNGYFIGEDLILGAIASAAPGAQP